MNAQVAKQLEESNFSFQEIVWPEIKDLLGGGEIVLAQSELDMTAGFDYLQRFNGGIRAFATRVQWKNDWRTFTIRESVPSGWPTEYQKRVDALEKAGEGRLYPHLTIQAYVSCKGEFGRLWSVGAIETEELFKWLKKHAGTKKVGHDHAREGGQGFAHIRWGFLRPRMYVMILRGQYGQDNETVYPPKV